MTIWNRLIPYKEWKTTFIGQQSTAAYWWCKERAIWRRKMLHEKAVLYHNWYRDVAIRARKLREQRRQRNQ